MQRWPSTVSVPAGGSDPGRRHLSAEYLPGLPSAMRSESRNFRKEVAEAVQSTRAGPRRADEEERGRVSATGARSTGGVFMVRSPRCRSPGGLRPARRVRHLEQRVHHGGRSSEPTSGCARDPWEIAPAGVQLSRRFSAATERTTTRRPPSRARRPDTKVKVSRKPPPSPATRSTT